MKLKFFVLALGILGALSTPANVRAANDGRNLNVWSGGAGPEVPFPLSAQVDFPWATIEGVWMARGHGFNTLFSFHIQSDANSNRILGVTQLMSGNNAIIAQGIGVSNDDARLVRAAMVVAASGANYWLIIRAFMNDQTQQVETVLTVRPFGGGEDSDVHVVVHKISAVPAYIEPSDAFPSARIR